MGAESKATHLFSTAYVEEVGVWPLQEANTRGNVATAIQALPAETASSAEPGFQYWKIRDYANAYSTGSVTPLEVRASSKSWIIRIKYRVRSADGTQHHPLRDCVALWTS